MINIIISGYGKMGKEIEALALQRQHHILARFDNPEEWKNLKALAQSKPVVIDFSQPEMVHSNIMNCFGYNIPVVVGTTGWNDQLPEIIEACKNGNHSLFTASNFSIGMNIFFAVNKYIASLMDEQESYDVSIQETHHIHKLDKPSGTAISLAGQVIQNLRRKKEWMLEAQGDDRQIRIDSIREGEIFGDHVVSYDSPVDKIEIKHSAKNRKGFALGAVLAAEWLQGKTGYFEMGDFLGI